MADQAPATPLLFDAHLDLSLNALEYNRDLRESIASIRDSEQGLQDLGGRGRGTVSFPAMRQANIGICVATLIAGCMRPAGPIASWRSPPQAWAMTQGQLAWYRAMEADGQLRQLTTAAAVDDHLQRWQTDPSHAPIGYLLSLEGADSIRDLDDLPRAYEQGLRAVGPAHYGNGRYALGHDRSGPLSPRGRELLAEMDRLGMILDVTHLCEPTFWEALDLYQGPVWASHHNCRALVDDPRQLSDRQIQALAARGGVIGVALDAWMLVPGWIRKQTLPGPAGVTLETVADHIDHCCQLLGNADHVGIGTDLDGGYGNEQCPADVDSIADLRGLISILRKRGYAEQAITKICHENFLSLTRQALG